MIPFRWWLVKSLATWVTVMADRIIVYAESQRDISPPETKVLPFRQSGPDPF